MSADPGLAEHDLGSELVAPWGGAGVDLAEPHAVEVKVLARGAGGAGRAGRPPGRPGRPSGPCRPFAPLTDSRGRDLDRVVLILKKELTLFFASLEAA